MLEFRSVFAGFPACPCASLGRRDWFLPPLPSRRLLPLSTSPHPSSFLRGPSPQQTGSPGGLASPPLPCPLGPLPHPTCALFLATSAQTCPVRSGALLCPPPSLIRSSHPTSATRGSSPCPRSRRRRRCGMGTPVPGWGSSPLSPSPSPFVPQVSPNSGRGLALSLLLLVLLLGWGLHLLQ